MLPLLYLAFWEMDARSLQRALWSLLATDCARRLATELAVPLLLAGGRSLLSAATRRRPPAPSGLQEPLLPAARAGSAQQRVWQELLLERYNAYDDYSEMMVEFAVVSLFAAVCPVAAALSLACNPWPMWSDRAKLRRVCRRPTPAAASGIGVWIYVLEFTVLLSVLSNCALFGFCTDQLGTVFPALSKEHTKSGAPRGFTVRKAGVFAVFGVEHALLLLWALARLLPMVPTWVATAQERRRFLRCWLEVSQDSIRGDKQAAMESAADFDVTALAFARWASEFRARLMAAERQAWGEMGAARASLAAGRADLAELREQTADARRQVRSGADDFREELSGLFAKITEAVRSNASADQDLRLQIQSLREQSLRNDAAFAQLADSAGRSQAALRDSVQELQAGAARAREELRSLGLRAQALEGAAGERAERAEACAEQLAREVRAQTERRREELRRSAGEVVAAGESLTVLVAAALACEPLAAFAELGARGWSAGDQNAGGRAPDFTEVLRRVEAGIRCCVETERVTRRTVWIGWGVAAAEQANAVTPTTPFEWSFLWSQPGAESVPKTPGLAAERVAEIAAPLRGAAAARSWVTGSLAQACEMIEILGQGEAQRIEWAGDEMGPKALQLVQPPPQRPAMAQCKHCGESKSEVASRPLAILGGATPQAPVRTLRERSATPGELKQLTERAGDNEAARRCKEQLRRTQESSVFPPVQVRAAALHAKIQQFERSLEQELDKVGRISAQAALQRHAVHEVRLSLEEAGMQYRVLVAGLSQKGGVPLAKGGPANIPISKVVDGAAEAAEPFGLDEFFNVDQALANCKRSKARFNIETANATSRKSAKRYLEKETDASLVMLQEIAIEAKCRRGHEAAADKMNWNLCLRPIGDWNVEPKEFHAFGWSRKIGVIAAPQQLHRIKAKSDSWGSTETHDLIKHIIAGPGHRRKHPDWRSWEPVLSSDFLRGSGSGLQSRQREADVIGELDHLIRMQESDGQVICPPVASAGDIRRPAGYAFVSANLEQLGGLWRSSSFGLQSCIPRPALHSFETFVTEGGSVYKGPQAWTAFGLPLLASEHFREPQALGFLFDPAVSTLRLDGIRVTGANVIEADYVAEGTIKLPWRPRIDPWAGHLVYTLDDSGLIAQQQEARPWARLQGQPAMGDRCEEKKVKLPILQQVRFELPVTDVVEYEIPEYCHFMKRTPGTSPASTPYGRRSRLAEVDFGCRPPVTAARAGREWAPPWRARARESAVRRSSGRLSSFAGAAGR
ncbi:unnamed protein product [Prorocentrum cordatum]|nr:unnamed protein product [Polarella glacialis]